MRRRGRYAPRYGELKRPKKPVAGPETSVLDNESYLVDIANGNLGNICVSCWLTSEDIPGGRRWGKLGPTDVAIMPFRTRAQLITPNVRLSTFDIEIFLRETDTTDSWPTPCPDICHRHQRQPPSKVCLVDLPAPTDVAHEQIATGPSNAQSPKPWRFRSEVIQDCDGQTRAAKWTWDANGYKPMVLHGGLALRHQGAPFVVACRARGKGFVSLRKHLRLRLDFSNDRLQPKWWTLVPQNSSNDLSDVISGLDMEMQSLNLNPSRSIPIGAQHVRGGAHGSNYELGTIGGQANVIAGNVYFAQDTNDPRSRRQPTDRDPHMAADVISQSMERLMRPRG